MSLLDDVLEGETLTSVRSTVIGYAQAARLAITSWVVGDVGQQTFEAVTEIVYAYTRTVARITRGFVSLDTSTDPGDEDAFDPENESLTPERGFLSYLGENTYGTVRTEETFATGFVDFVNAGVVARTFAPRALTFTWSLNSPPSPAPTYRNTEDASIYTNPDGTVTVLAGETRRIPVVAEERGTRSNSPPSSLSLTTALTGCSATNGAAVLTVNREAAPTYRTRCRQAPARLSFAGPADAIAYLAAKTLEGEPLENASGNPVNTNRAQVTGSSATGAVNAYFAAPNGPSTAEDVTAANDNIELNAYVVGDAISYTGSAAVQVTITVVGSGKLTPAPGRTVAAAKQAIVDALVDYFETFPIGGVDQVAGAGVMYTRDIQAIAAGAYEGLYNVQVTTPAGASTALALGRVAVLSTAVGSWTIT